MNWEDERYVRLYTRETPEWLAWRWEARALMPLVLRAVDRAGVLAISQRLGELRGLAVRVGLPLEVVRPGLEELLADGCVARHPLGLVVPNFIAAQESRRSSKARMAKSREERRDKRNAELAAQQSETQRNVELQNVTTSCETQPSVACVARHGTARDLGAFELEVPPAAKRKTRKPTKAKAPLPATWTPKPQHADRASKLDLDLEQEADAMRSWALAEGKELADWDARFDGWLLEACRRQQARRPARAANGHVGRAEPTPAEAWGPSGKVVHDG